MRVFITGLTGTLGTALARLHAGRGDQVFGCSRSEAAAVAWLKDNGRLATHYLGDAGDVAYPCSDVGRLLPTVDRVYHCAAMKHVDLCEQQPAEAFRQNVQVTEAVAHRCDQLGVPLVVVSTDKACLPTGVYGATKLLAEKISLKHRAAVVRLGNLIGSSGSVFAAWREAREKGNRVRLTDPDMTRFFLSVPAAAQFTADRHEPSRVVIPDPLRAVRMGDAAKAVAGSSREVELVGPRPGETRHQWLVAPGETVRAEDAHCGRYVLDESGTPLVNGLSSEWAGRWDTAELLAAAGVKV